MDRFELMTFIFYKNGLIKLADLTYKLWHVKRCIIRYFHIIILSSLFVFKYIYISILSEFITIVYFSIYIQYPFISIAYFPFIFYILSFVFYNFHYYFIFFISIIYFNICILFLAICIYWRHITILSPFISILYRRYLYSISFPFLFYTVNVFVLYTLFIYFITNYFMAKQSRSSSSLDRLTSDRTNTKTDRLWLVWCHSCIQRQLPLSLTLSVCLSLSLSLSSDI